MIPYSEKMLFSKILEQPPSDSNHCSSYSSLWQLLSGPDVVLSKREMLFSRAKGYIFFSDIVARLISFKNDAS